MKKIAAVLLACLAACQTPTGVSLPAGSERMIPPARFEQLWQKVEECSGLRSDYSYVQWFWGERSANVLSKHVIVLTREWANEERGVMHMMLHDKAQTLDHSDIFMNECFKHVWVVEIETTQETP